MEDFAEKVILFALCIAAWWMAFIVIAWAFIASIRAWSEVSDPIPADKHPAVRLKRQADTERRIKIMNEPEAYEVVTSFTGKDGGGENSFEWEVSYPQERRE